MTPIVCTAYPTLPESSVKAVNAAADLLRPKGRMALVFYPLAPGDQERKAVMESLLLRDDLELLECRRPDREACPVLLWRYQTIFKIRIPPGRLKEYNLIQDTNIKNIQ